MSEQWNNVGDTLPPHDYMDIMVQLATGEQIDAWWDGHHFYKRWNDYDPEFETRYRCVYRNVEKWKMP